jgi:hypothetical protein
VDWNLQDQQSNQSGNNGDFQPISTVQMHHAQVPFSSLMMSDLTCGGFDEAYVDDLLRLLMRLRTLRRLRG